MKGEGRGKKGKGYRIKTKRVIQQEPDRRISLRRRYIDRLSPCPYRSRSEGNRIERLVLYLSFE